MIPSFVLIILICPILVYGNPVYQNIIVLYTAYPRILSFYYKMKTTPSVHLSFFSSMCYPINLKLHIGTEICHMQSLTKSFVSFTHCPCLFCFKELHEKRFSALGMNEQEQGHHRSVIKPTLGSKVGLHPHCSLLWES